MYIGKPLKIAVFAGLALALAGCSDGINVFQRSNTAGVSDAVLEQRQNSPLEQQRLEKQQEGSVWDLFSRNRDDPNITVQVNRYIWTASLEILGFLPVQSADPFTGVIVTGFGTPPGGGRAYRATVLVKDPALDARSLTLSLNTRNGPASRETVRAVEDAILTRARQLRIQDGRL